MAASVVISPGHVPVSDAGLHGNCRKRVGRRVPTFHLANVRAARLAKMAKVNPARVAGVEASSLDAWREQRAETLKPSSGPSASVRMDALKARLAARGIIAP